MQVINDELQHANEVNNHYKCLNKQLQKQVQILGALDENSRQDMLFSFLFIFCSLQYFRVIFLVEADEASSLQGTTSSEVQRLGDESCRYKCQLTDAHSQLGSALKDISKYEVTIKSLEEDISCLRQAKSEYEVKITALEHAEICSKRDILQKQMESDLVANELKKVRSIQT